MPATPFEAPTNAQIAYIASLCDDSRADEERDRYYEGSETWKP